MILIDYRRGSKELEPYIHTKHEVTTLDYGDFSFVGMGDNTPTFVGIERKTLGDLIKSMEDGRLSGHQLIGLVERYTHIYLLIEGIWRPNPQSGILEQWLGKKWIPIKHKNEKHMARSIYNFVNGLVVACHMMSKFMMPVYTANPQQSGYWLDCTYSWWQKPWKDHRSYKKPYRPVVKLPKGTVLLRKLSPFERIVSGITGVSWVTITELQKHFPNVMSLALATEEQLKQVPGIGPKTAATIIKELR